MINHTKTLVLTLCLAFVVIVSGCANTVPSANIPKGSARAQTSAPASASPASPTPSHAQAASEEDGIVEIKEKLFVAQTNDVYYNSKDYLGKKIKLEGMFEVYEDPKTDTDFYAVIRYGPGCCGVDQNCGFEVRWEPNAQHAYPKPNDWVEAVGVLEKYAEGGSDYLRLSLESLQVLDVRGAETVVQ